MKYSYKEITVKEFRRKVGYKPTNDDMDRCNCPKTGQPGHMACGWCAEHDKPRYVCGCIYITNKFLGV